MTTTVSADEAEAHIRDLLARVEDGDEVIIARDGHPIARLVPDAQVAASDDKLGARFQPEGPAKWPPGWVELENGVVVSPSGIRLGTGRAEFGPLNGDWDDPLSEEDLGEFYVPRDEPAE